MLRRSCALALLAALAGGCSGDSTGGTDAGDDATEMGDDAVDADADDAADLADAGDTEVDATLTPEQEALLSVPETRRWTLPGLEAPVQVIRTEAGIPHLYAASRTDLARAYGFVIATDRFWMVDLARRLARGRLSALFGSILLETDITSRAQGLPEAAERLLGALSAERRAEFEAFAGGFNAYIDAVAAGELPPPSELELARILLGAQEPVDLMEPVDAVDIMAFAALVMAQSSCAEDELQRTAALLGTYGAYADAPFGDLREQGARQDIFYRIQPLADVFTDGLPAEKSGARGGSAGAAHPADDATAPLAFPAGLLERTASRVEAWRGLGQGLTGSNAWAVAAEHTTDGATLVAGDGHLPLSVPPYFHQAGLDTGVMGGDDWHARGNFIPGLPVLGVGTNGYVAWSFTCFYDDTVDFYREEVRLGADGLPDATRFDGEWRPLVRHDETYETRRVLGLQSPGGDVVEPRFVTFDGRRLLSIEGRAPEEGEPSVNLGDGPVVPEDIDGDDVITAISMDATYLDVGDAIGAFFDLAEAHSVDEFRAAQRRLTVMGSHFVAGDRDGHLVATGYHAAPCRSDLERNGNRFAAGSDPQVVLDGTAHGGFEIRLNPDGTVDETSEDPAACVVPFDAFPQAVDPAAGYLVSANNDPAGYSRDGSLADDDYYIGGPWTVGLRAQRIDELVSAAAQAGTADVASMAHIQGDTRSALGALWAPTLLEMLDGAATLADSPDALEGADQRVGELYAADAERYRAVRDALAAWVEADFPTPSGVATFYHEPAEGEGASSVATTLFNVWVANLVQTVFGDERLVPGPRLTDRQSLTRTLNAMLLGRGPDNPEGLASWSADTEESVFFDILDTPEVERSDEDALLALRDALAFLESDAAYGTDDMDAWPWGLIHVVRFESILKPFVRDIGAASLLIDAFAITPDVLPLTEEPLDDSDPRAALTGFPRPGDNFAVDRADPGYSAETYDYRDGPVMRMVIALYPDGRVDGVNIIPGGQSGLNDSPHYADQAALWLGNETLPLRFSVDEVVAGAEGREVFVPEM